MKNTMKRAHEIRKEAAIKWSCEVSEIVFSICLEMAWRENKMSDVYKTEKGHEIEIVINQVGDTSPVRTTKNIERLNIALEFCEMVIGSGKAKPGSIRERLASGKIKAIKTRLNELS